jgi:hypothetical protein
MQLFVKIGKQLWALFIVACERFSKFLDAKLDKSKADAK